MRFIADLGVCNTKLFETRNISFTTTIRQCQPILQTTRALAYLLYSLLYSLPVFLYTKTKINKHSYLTSKRACAYVQNSYYSFSKILSTIYRQLLDSTMIFALHCHRCCSNTPEVQQWLLAYSS